VTLAAGLRRDSGALSFALAAMFVFTAVSHFHPRTRPDLIRMVPASLPAPELLVTAGHDSLEVPSWSERAAPLP